MKSAVLNFLAVAALALLLSASHLLGPDELQAEQDVADDLAEVVSMAAQGVRP